MSDASPQAPSKQTCGLVMPIASIDGLPEAHWQEVRSILVETLDKVGLVARLVSDAADVGVIHKRIVQNLYTDPIVVCDVSARNPNVMCELGMRLAFDKPTVLIKDDKTPFSFDTGNIEHIEYPRDLRFSQIVSFKEKLTQKVMATLEAAKNPEFSTFLKHFGSFKVATLQTEEVTKDELLLEEVRELKTLMRRANALPAEPHASLPSGSNTVINRIAELYMNSTGRASGSLSDLLVFFEKLPREQKENIARDCGVTIKQVLEILSDRELRRWWELNAGPQFFMPVS